jgi:hypothetical protein
VALRRHDGAGWRAVPPEVLSRGQRLALNFMALCAE